METENSFFQLAAQLCFIKKRYCHVVSTSHTMLPQLATRLILGIGLELACNGGSCVIASVAN